MAVGTFVAGRYAGTWDADMAGAGSAVPLGIMEEGYDLSWRTMYEDIRESDAHGAQLIEMIYRGVTDLTLTFTALEYKDATFAVATQFAPIVTTGARSFTPGVIARRGSDMGATIALTATASTPAASSPATLTAAICVLSEQVVRLLLTSKLRKVPLQVRILPWDNSGTTTYFTTT